MSEEVVPESTPEIEQEVTEEINSEDEVSQPQDVEAESSTETEPQSAEEAISEALKEESGEPVAEDKPDEQSEPAEEAPAENKQEDPKAEAEEESPDDLYQEPEGLKDKGKQRFQDLVADNKNKAEKLDQAQKAVAEIQTTVQSTGMNAEELGFVFDYGRLAISKDKNQQQEALEMAKNEVRRLSTQLGIEQEGSGIDLLSNHPDLQKKVDAYELNREDALEIRNYREDQAQAVKAQEDVQASQARASQAEQTESQALQAVESFMDSMKKTDIDYKAKETILLSQVQAIRANYHPSQWPAAVKQLYDTAGQLSAKQVMENKTATQPISTKNVDPGNQVATSALDAVKLALAGG